MRNAMTVDQFYRSLHLNLQEESTSNPRPTFALDRFAEPGEFLSANGMSTAWDA